MRIPATPVVVLIIGADSARRASIAADLDRQLHGAAHLVFRATFEAAIECVRERADVQFVCVRTQRLSPELVRKRCSELAESIVRHDRKLKVVIEDHIHADLLPIFWNAGAHAECAALATSVEGWLPFAAQTNNPEHGIVMTRP